MSAAFVNNRIKCCLDSLQSYIYVVVKVYRCNRNQDSILYHWEVHVHVNPELLITINTYTHIHHRNTTIIQNRNSVYKYTMFSSVD